MIWSWFMISLQIRPIVSLCNNAYNTLEILSLPSSFIQMSQTVPNYWVRLAQANNNSKAKNCIHSLSLWPFQMAFSPHYCVLLLECHSYSIDYLEKLNAALDLSWLQRQTSLCDHVSFFSRNDQIRSRGCQTTKKTKLQSRQSEQQQKRWGPNENGKDIYPREFA